VVISKAAEVTLSLLNPLDVPLTVQLVNGLVVAPKTASDTRCTSMSSSTYFLTFLASEMEVQRVSEESAVVSLQRPFNEDYCDPIISTEQLLPSFSGTEVCV
jgi:hypothetical protein